MVTSTPRTYQEKQATFIPWLRKQSISCKGIRYGAFTNIFLTTANFISKEYFECCPIKYAPPYSDSFIISSVYYKGSISSFRMALFSSILCL